MATAFPSLTQHAALDLASRPSPRRSFFGRLLDALVEARQQEADRQVALLIARSGGRLTDSLERDIARRAGA